MKTSETTTAIFKSMIEVAPEINAIGKSKQAYGYKYATLDSLIDMLRTVLPKHDLWFIQIPTRLEGKSSLTTRVIHNSGEWFEDTIEMTDTELQGKANDTQKVGASITYFRRYALSAIFGVATEEDVDGNINNVSKQPVVTKQAVAPKQQQKKDPTPYLLHDMTKRIEAGETKESILKSYAEILKTDSVRPIEQLNDSEKSTLANFIYKQNKERENV